MAVYAAYGPNMDPGLMSLLAPHSPQRATGWLSGWRLTFGGEQHLRDGALATVVEAPGRDVFVALYDVSRFDEKALDAWESVTAYRKIRVRVATLEGSEPAWLYVVDGYEGGLPSTFLLARIADAAEKAGAPADYVDELRRRPCRNAGP